MRVSLKLQNGSLVRLTSSGLKNIGLDPNKDYLRTFEVQYVAVFDPKWKKYKLYGYDNLVDGSEITKYIADPEWKWRL